MQAEFTLYRPGRIRRALHRALHFHAVSRMLLVPDPGQQQKEAIAELHDSGQVVLPAYLSGDLLERLQEDLESALRKLVFETPCLAQSRIHPDRHKRLIENHLYASVDELQREGMTFGADEVRDYDQVIRDFQPSTLKAYMLAHSEAYRRVWFDPYLLTIVAGYLGLVPMMVEAYVRRNFPSKYRVMNHFWHRDLNSPMGLLKMFIFLNDCKLQTGPHEYVRGSHRNFSVLNGSRYYSDKELDRQFPEDSPDRFTSTVPAGTIVLEDTRGLHRARVPVVGHRDLGFAVFVPARIGRQVPCYYRLPANFRSNLSAFQRAFVPARIDL